MDLADVIDQSVETHPQADPAKAQQILADVMLQGAVAPRQPGEPDRKGNPFDPGKHDGTLTARGTWRKMRRNNPGATGAPHCDVAGLEQSQDQSTLEALQQPTFDARAVAESWLDLVFTTLPMVLGDAWEPSAKERSKLTDALERWMVAAGITYDLPPGLSLIAAIGVYAAPRLMKMEFVRKKIDRLFKRKEPSVEEEKENAGPALAA